MRASCKASGDRGEAHAVLRDVTSSVLVMRLAQEVWFGGDRLVSQCLWAPCHPASCAGHKVRAHRETGEPKKTENQEARRGNASQKQHRCVPNTAPREKPGAKYTLRVTRMCEIFTRGKAPRQKKRNRQVRNG